MEPVTVPFTKLDESVAKSTGHEDFYKQNIASYNKYANRRLHLEPNIFFSDVNIENHYRFKFANSYTNNIGKIYKGYFDI